MGSVKLSYGDKFSASTEGNYSFLKDALLDAHEIIVEASKYAEKYPALSNLYFGMEMFSFIENDGCSYQEINGVPTIDLNDGYSAQINSKSIIFLNNEGEQTKIVELEDYKDLAKAIEIMDSHLDKSYDYEKSGIELEM